MTATRELTDAEIMHVFETLGLADPRVREKMAGLQHPAEAAPNKALRTTYAHNTAVIEEEKGEGNA